MELGEPLVRCEVFPLVLLGDQAVHLRRVTAEAGGQAWWLAPASGEDPSLTVRAALAAGLPALFRPASALVHSTSWRFEPASSTLVLSYLAILDSPRGRPGIPGGFEPELLAAAASAVDGGSGPVDPAAVLAHGLRHFALLRVSDAVIAAALPVEWHRFLSERDPLPAGLLDHYAHRSPALA